MASIRVTYKLWIVVLSIIAPGLGHWIVGKRDNAFFILSTFLFHLSLAYTLLHMVVIEQPVSVAYLMLVIPWHYFYGIYNSLQSMHDQVRTNSKLLLVLASLISIAALLLWIPSDRLYPYKQTICSTYPSVLMLCTVAYYLLHLSKRSNGKLFVFRLSASISILLFSVLFNLQSFVPIQWSKWLLALPIIIGLELVLLFLYRYFLNQQRRFTIDVSSICIGALLIVSAYFVIQYRDYPEQLLASFHAPMLAEDQLDGETGYYYELPPIKVPASDDYKALQLRHLNGYVRLMSGEVDDITIYPELYVATDDEQEALNVKAQSKIEVLFDEKLSIVSSLPSYKLNRYPRMNITVVLPKQNRFLQTADVRVEHGAISISNLVLSKRLKVESNTAAINIRSIIGPIETVSKSGNIYMNKTVGTVDVQTKKGDITLLNPSRAINATTLNGDITVQAKQLYGDWDLSATVGNIQLTLPKDGDFELSAKVSFGHITMGQLSRQYRKELYFRQGKGKYVIDLYASNYILLK